MKKILHVTMSNAYGGAETVIFSIIDKIKKYNEFYYFCPKGNIENLLKKKNINYKAMDVNKISKEIKKSNCDIIHAHDFKASIVCALYSRGKVIISHLHTNHDWLKKISLKSIVYLLVSRRFKNIIIVSESMAKDIWFYKFIKNKTKVMINPIDRERIIKLSDSETFNKNYDLAFLGRLSDYKDPLRFIEIIHNIKCNKKDIKAVIIGDGELKEECIQKIKECNLSENIEMVGFLENPFPLIKKSRLLIMPSKIEAFGLSAIQSMVLGKPVVATNVGGLKDIINSKNGMLCESNEEFISNILDILNNNELYDKLSKESKRSSKEIGNIDKYMDKLIGIYDY